MIEFVMIFLPGELLSGSAGIGFTPHIINVAVGEVCDLLNLYSLLVTCNL